MSDELMIFPGSDLKSEIDVHSENVRDKINQILTSTLVSAALTPHIALERVRSVLMPFHISIPKYNFMDEQDGAAVFDVHQFGLTLGFDVDGNPVEKEEPDPLYIYFEYAMNAIGTFDVFCEIVNEDELDELCDPDDVDETDAVGVDDHYQINHDEHSGHSLKEASLSTLANYIVKAEKDEHKTGKRRKKGIKLAIKKFAKGIHGKGKVVAGTINEVSTERMKKYLHKAKESFNKARDDYDDPKKRDEASKTIGKRNTGIWRVKDKIDHLKETSDERKAAYVQAADDQIGEYNKIAQAMRKKYGFTYEKGPEQEKLLKQALRRSKGIKHVLTKGAERMHEEKGEENLQEVSRERLQDYVKKASKESASQKEKAKAHFKQADDARKNGSKEQAKHHSQLGVDAYKKQQKRAIGINLADRKRRDFTGSQWPSKLTSGAIKVGVHASEEKQLDEVSKERIKKYISAAKDDRDFQFKKASDHESDANEAYRKKKKSPAFDYHNKAVEYHANKWGNRVKGIERAKKRLDEMSHGRIADYVAKAQKDYAENARVAADAMIDNKDISKENSKMFKRLKGLRAANKRNQPDLGI